MKYMNFVASACVASSLILCSCASIVSKNSYPVSIQSTPSQANFVIQDAKGNTVHSGKTPSVVTLKASSGFFKSAKYTITYSKKGFPTRVHQVSATLDGWYLGNVLIGGLVGMLIVDPATGSMWAMEKQQHVHLGDPSTAALFIKPIQSLTDEERQRLIPIS